METIHYQGETCDSFPKWSSTHWLDYYVRWHPWQGKVPTLFSVWTNAEPSNEHWTHSCRRVSHLSTLWNASSSGQYIQSSGSWHYVSCNIKFETDVQLSIRRHHMSSMYPVNLFNLMTSRWWHLGQVPVPRTESHDAGILNLKKRQKSNRNRRLKYRLKRKRNRHLKEHYYLHFRGLMISFNHRLNFWNSTWSIITCQLNNSREETSALKLPKEIYDKYDQITKSCVTCSKAKIALSKSQGIRNSKWGLRRTYFHWSWRSSN